MYKLFRPLLFSVDPESIHHLIIKILQIKSKVPGFKRLLKILFIKNDSRLEREVAGLRFKNPVGLAAGFDKDAVLIDELACFGFSFIEIGTLTPKAQPGNDKPRLFRLPEDSALINRMGFNNKGVSQAVTRLRKRKSKVIVGGNIGKNKITPNENALDDYGICFEELFPHVDYFVINVSSPNTPGLRELQEKEPLRKLLLFVKELNTKKSSPKPIFLKIAPDLTEEQLNDIVEILQETKIDGVIATNTTTSRANLITSQQTLDEVGNGGLSGRPLQKQSNTIIKYLRNRMGTSFPIIGVGGIMTPEDAIEKLNAGANLVQIYTGFIYEGPSIVKRINKMILETS